MTTPSGPQHGGSPAPQPKPRVSQMALASVVTAAVGFILWPIVGGWATLIAASIALGLGFLALSRISRTLQRGRWAAITGIGLGVVFFAILMTVIAWDFVSPIRGTRKRPGQAGSTPRHHPQPATPASSIVASADDAESRPSGCGDAGAHDRD
jgi:hypothetical protein